MIKKISKFLLFIFILISITAIIIIHVLGNFHEVNNGIYRSAQLNKFNLEYYSKKYEIKTILNLRGESKREVYLDEINISKKLNIKHINHEISNSQFLDFNRTSQIVNILKNAKKPMLIHCAGGADRTSLVSALYQYAVANESVETSKEEFSALYGYLPYFRKQVIAMSNSFDNYVKNRNKTNE